MSTPLTLEEIEELLTDVPDLQRLHAVFIACKLALPIWERYVASPEADFTFADSCFYIFEEMDSNIPFLAIEHVERCLQEGRLEPDPSVDSGFSRPIGALGDYMLDPPYSLEFPYPVEMGFYSFYNMHRLCRSKSESTERNHPNLAAIAIHQAHVSLIFDASGIEKYKETVRNNWFDEWWDTYISHYPA